MITLQTLALATIVATPPASVAPSDAATTAAKSAPTVQLTYPAAITDSFTGPVYVMFTSSRRRSPSSGPDWFSPEPLYRVDVVDWTPGEVLTMGPETKGFPATLGELEPGNWRLQAVMRSDPDVASIGGGDVTVSGIETISLEDENTWPLSLVIDTPKSPRELWEIPGSKSLSHRSELLSTFHGRDITMRAMAFFPDDFEPEADRNWPVLYVIGGFAGGLEQAPMAKWMWGGDSGVKDMIIVYLEGECGTGHHVFADSANNGPWGQALVEEFIPWLESQYPLVDDSQGRLLTGHSSGGWSSLWLQVTYPEFFGGTWSTAPDPVDFRAFQDIDIYAENANAYRHTDGTRVPLARNGKTPTLFYDDFCAMEEAIGDGGQIRSFEWVFSPRGDDDRPRPLFDRTTGEVDPAVAKAWARYDISRILHENWKTLGPKLAGKIHVYMGDMDTFYLTRATELLKERMDAMNTDAVIEIMPGDHSSILQGTLRQRIANDMNATIQAR